MINSTVTRTTSIATAILSTMLLTACTGTRPADIGVTSLDTGGNRLTPCPESPNCVSSFEDNKDEQKAINAMASNLKLGGYLVIDFMNAKNVIANLVASEQKIIDGITFDISRKVVNQHVIKDIYHVA